MFRGIRWALASLRWSVLILCVGSFSSCAGEGTPRALNLQPGDGGSGGWEDPGSGNQGEGGSGGDIQMPGTGGDAGDDGNGEGGAGDGEGGSGGEEGDGGEPGVEPICGDGIQDPGEECDHGLGNSDITPNACRNDCSAPFCGDGVTDDQHDESCDDGENNSDTTPNACREDCSRPFCGDGIVDDLYGETCDEGLANSDEPDATCRTDCTVRRCGDGVVDTGEECDDGDFNSDFASNACRNDCSLPSCGDGVIDHGESCDEGAANGSLGSACREDCTSCGDGFIDTEHGEICDDGVANNDFEANACRTNCQPAGCGDGVIDDGEQCDGANLGGKTCANLGYVSGALGCTESCDFDLSDCWDGAVCGDGVLTLPSEQCDDGEQTPGDGCDENCLLEDGGACGTMISLNAVAHQQSNKWLYDGTTEGAGNNSSPDGCDSRPYVSGEDITFGWWVRGASIGASTRTKVTFRVTSRSAMHHAVYVRTLCSDPDSELACGAQMIPGATSGAMNSNVSVEVDKGTQLYVTVDTAESGSDTGGAFTIEVTEEYLLDGGPGLPGGCTSNDECPLGQNCVKGICMPGTICKPGQVCQSGAEED